MAMENPSMWPQLSAKTAGNDAQVSEQDCELTNPESTADATEYRTCLIRYARADCLQLATMMLEKLPPELRELVYQFLCIEDRPILVGPPYHSRKYDKEALPESGLVFPSEPHCGADVDDDDEEIEYEELVSETPDGRLKRDHTYKPPSDMVVPGSHIFNPRYMGPTVSLELQKMYYTSNTFSICTVEQAIRNFLQLPTGYAMRKWRDGKPPAMPKDLILSPSFLPGDYVRNLQIRIKAEQLEFPGVMDITNSGESQAKAEQLLGSISDNLRGLHVPSLLADAHELRIEFVIMLETRTEEIHHARLAPPHFAKLLPAMEETVYTFKHERENCNVRVTLVDEGLSPFPLDYTDKVTWTKAQ
ncbi:hypothetical protein T440DRAFT_469164 [Plenodomus tracheiphilus IPT5]|uniref:Uncharacterized protein n=1 Tax=Plenodomus tracheiphilus IPT5 TaxID=1408161 RepID=A0A6A7B506_9PLEO|nr:hypothetical protein T440DRAFT_469164 [Plenodomus tracheiphilus IPT5]